MLSLFTVSSSLVTVQQLFLLCGLGTLLAMEEHKRPSENRRNRRLVLEVLVYVTDHKSLYRVSHSVFTTKLETSLEKDTCQHNCTNS